MPTPSSSHASSAAAIGDAVAKATAEHVKLELGSQLSVKDLKKSLRTALADSGVLNNIKSQLRREFIQNMKQTANGAPSIYEQAQQRMDLSTRITFSSVYHLLKSRGLQHSLAVFTAETGLEASKTALLSEVDIVRAMNLMHDSPVYETIVGRTIKAEQNMLTAGSASASIHTSDKENQSVQTQTRQNVLDLLMETMFRGSGKKTRDMCMQTDSTANKPRQILDQTLLEVREQYEQTLRANKGSDLGTEERILQYQQQCDERVKKDVAMQMQLFREQESVRIRIEEAAKARLAFQGRELDLEGQLQRKNSLLEAKEAQEIRHQAEIDRRYQQELFDTRQKMQAEVQEMRARELATGRRFELEHQGLKMFELQLKDVQGNIEAREREVLAREKEVDRRAAAAVKAAKEEARDHLRAEFEEILRDRKRLALDRQKFEDECNKHTGMLDSLKTTRTELTAAHEQLQSKDQKLEAAERALKRAEGIIRGDYVDPATQQNQLLVTVRRNADLEAQLPVLLAENTKLKGAQAAFERAQGTIEAQSKEITHLKLATETAQQQATSKAEDVEELKEKLEAERVKVIALTLKSKELERLLNEKRKVIGSLATGGRAAAGAAGVSELASGVFGNSARTNAAALRDVTRDGRQRSYQEMQHKFAFKKAEEFANALILQRRASSQWATGPAGGAPAASTIAPPQGAASPAPSSPTKARPAGQTPSHIPRYSPPKQPAAAVTTAATVTTAAASVAPVSTDKLVQDAEAEQRLRERQDYIEQMEAEARAWELEKAKRQAAAQTQTHAQLQAQVAAQAEAARQALEMQTQALEVARKKAELDRELADIERERAMLALAREQQQREVERANAAAVQTTVANAAAEQVAAQLLQQQERQLQQMREQIQAAAAQEEKKHAQRLAELRREQQAAAALVSTAQATTTASTPSKSSPGLSRDRTDDTTLGSAQDLSNISYNEQNSLQHINLSTIQQPVLDPVFSAPVVPVAIAGAAVPEAESRRMQEDAARIAEARAKVLARRKGKQARDEQEQPVLVAAPVTREISPEKSAGSSSEQDRFGVSINNKNTITQKPPSYSRTEDSDVEVTAGNISGGENSDNDSGWF